MTEDIVATGTKVRRRSEKSGFFHFCPTFAYLLVLYILVEAFTTDVRAVLFTLERYALSWVEVFYLLAAFFGMMELLKVSEPKVDNTLEAIWIGVVWVVYFGLFVLGATSAKIWFISFSIFNSTEFFLLTVISGVQVVAAFRVNSRTLQLQIADTR